MNTPLPKRGRARRVNVRSAKHYNVVRLQEEAATPLPPTGPRQLSPAALWILLAYLPPEVRARPWVRHLVEQQLARVETIPGLDPRPTPMVRPRRSSEPEIAHV